MVPRLGSFSSFGLRRLLTPFAMSTPSPLPPFPLPLAHKWASDHRRSAGTKLAWARCTDARNEPTRETRRRSRSFLERFLRGFDWWAAAQILLVMSSELGPAK